MCWAMSNMYDVTHAVTFDYGQRHAIEIECAKKIAKMAGVQHEVIEVKSLKQISDSALIDTSIDLSLKHRGNKTIPASFVPGRNIIFLTLAAVAAYKYGINTLVTGVCQTDYSGYPDCRRHTITSLETTLRLGMEFFVEILLFTVLSSIISMLK